MKKTTIDRRVETRSIKGKRRNERQRNRLECIRDEFVIKNRRFHNCFTPSKRLLAVEGPRQRLQRFSSALEAENQILTFHVTQPREMIILNRHPSHRFQSPHARSEEVQFKASSEISSGLRKCYALKTGRWKVHLLISLLLCLPRSSEPSKERKREN